MISRRLFATCFLVLLLAPSSGWALNVSENLPGAQSAPASVAPAKDATETAAPAQPAQGSVAPAKAATEHANPAKSAPVSAAPAKPAPARRFPLQAPPIRPLPLQSAPTATSGQSTTNVESQLIDIEVFVREDCPLCDQAKEFLVKLGKLQPQLKIVIRDVRKEPAALELLKRMTQNQGEATLDYPAFVVGGQLIIGFSEENSTAQLILDTLALSLPANHGPQNCETGKEPSCGLIPPAPVEQPENITINLFGHNIPLIKIGMPAFTLAMGVLDGLTHGSTWILILLISLLAPMKNRPFMLATAGTFIAVKGIIYFILISMWFNLFVLIEMPRILQIIIASISLIAGAVYLKKYMYFGQSLSVSSHEIANPGIYTRIRKIIEAKSLVTALLGTTVFSIFVLAGEFPYASVFPALYTQVLTLHNLDKLSNYAYLLLYDFSYILTDIVILCVGVITLNQPRPGSNEGLMVKLFSGLILVALGIYLLLTKT